jgi:hypothetical protein
MGNISTNIEVIFVGEENPDIIFSRIVFGVKRLQNKK